MKQTNIAKQLGARGGKATLKKYGKEHFSEMVKRRWAKVKKETPNQTEEALREKETTPKKNVSFFKPPQS